MADKVVKKGDIIKVSYTGTFEDGAKFDTTKGRDPLEFKVGEASLIKGFQDGVVGMKLGEEKNIKLSPEEAYGPRNEKFVQEVPKDKLPKDLEPKEGMILTLKNPEGQVIYAKIAKIKDSSIMLDLNHPLAGKTLNFKIKVESIKE